MESVTHLQSRNQVASGPQRKTELLKIQPLATSDSLEMGPTTWRQQFASSTSVAAIFMNFLIRLLDLPIFFGLGEMLFGPKVASQTETGKADSSKESSRAPASTSDQKSELELKPAPEATKPLPDHESYSKHAANLGTMPTTESPPKLLDLGALSMGGSCRTDAEKEQLRDQVKKMSSLEGIKPITEKIIKKNLLTFDPAELPEEICATGNDKLIKITISKDDLQTLLQTLMDMPFITAGGSANSHQVFSIGDEFLKNFTIGPDIQPIANKGNSTINSLAEKCVRKSKDGSSMGCSPIAIKNLIATASRFLMHEKRIIYFCTPPTRGSLEYILHPDFVAKKMPHLLAK